jgi:tRNA(Ile)-lysidine synthase
VGPHPAVAELRNAVRQSLSDLAPGDLVLAACSGGADSLALAAALAFVAPRLSLRAGGVTVDHQLQAGSARQAERVAGQLAALGLDPVRVLTVTVTGPGGPEAAARTARYQALEEARAAAGATVVLLGHTRDDQAETVLLGLARGSGARSLAGMAAAAGTCLRPLLGLRRDQTAAACAALGLHTWDDPHNADRRYARVRVRLDALPALEAALGPGVAAALARTAGQLRADADALDELAGQAAARLFEEADPAGAGLAVSVAGLAVNVTGLAVSVAGLAALPAALRGRVLRMAAVAAGCPAGALTAAHAGALDELVTGWHGQRWIDLPGGVRAAREYGKLRLRAGGQDHPPPGRPGTQAAQAQAAHVREDADGRQRHGSGPEGGADHHRAATGPDQRAGRAD